MNESVIAKPEHRMGRRFRYAGDQVIQLSDDFVQIVFAGRLFVVIVTTIIMLVIIVRMGDGCPFRQSVGFDLIHRCLDDIFSLFGEFITQFFPRVVRAAIDPLIPALSAFIGKSVSGVLKAFDKPLNQGVDPCLTIIVIRRFMLETEIDVPQKLVRADIRFPVIFGTDGVFPQIPEELSELRVNYDRGVRRLRTHATGVGLVWQT